MSYVIYRLYLSFEGTREGRVGSSNENRPKWCVIWVIGTCFIFLNHVFYILTIYVIYRFYLPFQGTRKAATTKMGSNDALRRVVWAISMCFFLISMFIYTNYVLLFYLGMKKARVGKDNKNGPKRRQTHRLGQRYVFFLFSFFFSCFMCSN